MRFNAERIHVDLKVRLSFDSLESDRVREMISRSFDMRDEPRENVVGLGTWNSGSPAERRYLIRKFGNDFDDGIDMSVTCARRSSIALSCN